MLRALTAPDHRLDALVAAALFVLVFIGECALASHWAANGLFDQYNVIFNTDANYWLENMAHGWTMANFNHPLLAYFFAVPIRAIETLTPGVTDPVAFREWLALGIAPLCAAGKGVACYATFRLLELSRLDATLLASLAVVAFSSVVYGAIPESYGVTGLALALVTLTSVACAKYRDRLSPLVFFIGSAVLAVGTTTSNVIHVGWSQWFVQATNRRGGVRSLVHAVAISGLTLAATLGVFYGLKQVRGGEPQAADLLVSTRFVRTFLPSVQQQAENTARLPETLARTYIPTTPRPIPNEIALQNRDPIKIELTYNGIDFGWGSASLYLAAVLAFGGGAVASIRKGGAWRWLTLGSAASMLTFGALYSVFGMNTYLYTQHLQVPSLFLLAGWFAYFTRMPKAVYAALIGLIGALLVGDVIVLDRMNDLLMPTNDSGTISYHG